MKIALTVDPEIPVPPKLYGGIERIVDMLVQGLHRRGHEITLFANRDSKVPCRFVPFEGRSSISKIDTLRNAATLFMNVRRENFDVIHNFSRLIYLLPLRRFKIPLIMSYQREISLRSVYWGHRWFGGQLHFTAISDYLTRNAGQTGSWHVIPNGVDLEKYHFEPLITAGAPLVFLGRIENIKGTHLAIEIAKQSGRRLVIAGNIEPEHEAYFKEKVRPFLEQGRIDYIGPVDDAEKNRLLGQAAALLMPILWDEPFGIVMAEALACGTPVVAMNRGAVPEIVVHGENGFIGDTVEALVEGVRRIPEIDRAKCRQTAEQKFSDDRVVSAYEKLYEELVR